MSGDYSVYELYDAVGRVLYVGQSNDLDDRARSHAKKINRIIQVGDSHHHRQPLYMALAVSYDRLVTGTDIMRIIESGFETRRTAEVAEKVRIDWHNSQGNRLYNKAGNHQLTLAGQGVRVPSLSYQPVDVTQLVTELGVTLTVDHPLVKLSVVRVGPGEAAPANHLPSGRIHPAFVVVGQSTYIFPFTKTELMKKWAVVQTLGTYDRTT